MVAYVQNYSAINTFDDIRTLEIVLNFMFLKRFQKIFDNITAISHF